jgi:hypothetical protein
MRKALASFHSTMDVYLISVGGKFGAIRGKYRNELEDIIEFAPTDLIIHCGHNDCVYDQQRNPTPLYSRVVIHMIQELVAECLSDHYDLRVFVSSMLPRMCGPSMDMAQCNAYNRLAKRFGELLRSAAWGDGPPFIELQNRRVWASYFDLVPNTLFYQREHFDGLHINEFGQYWLAGEWMEALGYVD